MSDYGQLLLDLSDATQARAKAEADQKRLALATIQAGATKVDVAATAKISRATLDRWLDGDNAPERYDVDRTIKDAFTALVAAGSQQAIGYLDTQLLPPMALQLIGGLARNLGPLDFKWNSAVGRAVMRAQVVCDAAIQYHKFAGRWPRTVSVADLDG